MCFIPVCLMCCWGEGRDEEQKQTRRKKHVFPLIKQEEKPQEEKTCSKKKKEETFFFVFLFFVFVYCAAGVKFDMKEKTNQKRKHVFSSLNKQAEKHQEEKTCLNKRKEEICFFLFSFFFFVYCAAGVKFVMKEKLTRRKA